MPSIILETKVQYGKCTISENVLRHAKINLVFFALFKIQKKKGIIMQNFVTFDGGSRQVGKDFCQ